MSAAGARVLVYGGRGALGSAIVDFFKSKQFWVASIDMHQNEHADVNITVDPASSWEEQQNHVSSKVTELLGDHKLDAILCVAGGWAGGNAKSKDLVKNCDMMWKQSVWTSVIAGSLAAHHLKENGVLALTGAQPALTGTPGMMGYGMAKAAVHQFVASLAADKSGLPSKAMVAAILPVTLDTPMNRKWMAKADQSTWTPLETVAELFYNWTLDKDRPQSGSLIQLFTKNGDTEFVKA